MAARSVDRARVRELFLKGMNDVEIADELKCAHVTISKIRNNELHLPRTEMHMMDWRKVTMLKNSNQNMFYIPELYLKKMGFDRTQQVFFKITFQAPNVLILNFKNLEDIHDKTHVSTLRGKAYEHKL